MVLSATEVLMEVELDAASKESIVVDRYRLFKFVTIKAASAAKKDARLRNH
jgi:hypothetical protein